jgi:hypothetical protein
LAASLAWLPGCGTGDGGDMAEDGEPDPGNCIEDNASDSMTAIALMSGMKATGMICPKGDLDYYSIDVPAGNTLIDVSVGFPSSVTKVNLEVQLYGPDGMTPTPNGNLIGKSKVGSTLLAPTPGKYFISVRDAMNSSSDSLNSYVITATPAMDPDTHEPNDTLMTAKAPDANQGWFAYLGDVDVFKATVPPGNQLIRIDLENPPTSKTPVHYQVQDSMGNPIVVGDAPPAAMMYDAIHPVGGPGDYYVLLSGPAGPPDRSMNTPYRLMVSALPEKDGNEPNNDGAHATPLAGAAFSGGNSVTYGQASGSIGALGDRDFFKLDSSNGLTQAGVLVATASIGATPMVLALDVLVPEPNSPCTKDTDCAALNIPCQDDGDCELSHTCLQADSYAFCKNPPCRLCVGGSACVPAFANGPMVCAANQFNMHSDMGGGAQKLSTAVPIITGGTHYVVVHEFGDDMFDYGTSYTLDVNVVPEPDPNDATIASRNNFYNPYPTQMDDITPAKSQKRAIDVSAAFLAGTTFNGYISYASDEDWYSFNHPCPGMDCGIVFNFTNPGPSPVGMRFFMLQDDLTTHETFAYLGNLPTMAPVPGTFGTGSDCHQCSFAAKGYMGKYYMQIRGTGASTWDVGHPYSWSATVTPGCPATCSEAPKDGMGNPQCFCWCNSLMDCPPAM